MNRLQQWLVVHNRWLFRRWVMGTLRSEIEFNRKMRQPGVVFTPEQLGLIQAAVDEANRVTL